MNIWQSYKQERDCLEHFVRLANTPLKDEKSARDNHVLACNFAKYSPIFFTRRLSNKPFFNLVVNNTPHLKSVAILSCNLLLKACFADVNVSQRSVATYARCDGTFNIHLTAIFPKNLPMIF